MARTSPNLRLHPLERARRDRAAQNAALLAYRQAGSPEAEGPYSVVLVVRRARKLDGDNALAGAKAVLDGLFNRRRLGEGLADDDGPDNVQVSAVIQETSRDYYRREEVLVRVTPRE